MAWKLDEIMDTAAKKIAPKRLFWEHDSYRDQVLVLVGDKDGYAAGSFSGPLLCSERPEVIHKLIEMLAGEQIERKPSRFMTEYPWLVWRSLSEVLWLFPKVVWENFRQRVNSDPILPDSGPRFLIETSAQLTALTDHLKAAIAWFIEQYSKWPEEESEK